MNAEVFAVLTLPTLAAGASQAAALTANCFVTFDNSVSVKLVYTLSDPAGGVSSRVDAR